MKKVKINLQTVDQKDHVSLQQKMYISKSFISLYNEHLCFVELEIKTLPQSFPLQFQMIQNMYYYSLILLFFKLLNHCNIKPHNNGIKELDLKNEMERCTMN